MDKIIPSKLRSGDKIRIIAPSRSISLLNKETCDIADQRLSQLGLEVSFGKHVEENDKFNSSSIKSRIEDLNEAFADKSINGILTVIGGFNSNQLLNYLDFDLIRKNPKILCGYSDITALSNTIYSKTGLISYSGPHYSSFGQKLHFDYTLEYFKRCLFESTPFDLIASQQWSDDPWYKNQEERNLIDNEGYWIINNGKASGSILGANLCTFNLLQGTDFMPNLADSILFLEDDELTFPAEFDRNLQSVIHLPGFNKVRGIVIGRFQKVSEISKNALEEIIKTKEKLNHLPVIANVDFGHTDPKVTFPIGGVATIEANDKAKITISEH
jgi:muramoyltetrapeptide carboxypeptidase LdcA involved in peptidoglycan recycling